MQATDFAALREQCIGDARVAETEIRRMIREQKGETFSFSFDAEANRLADRRGSELDEVLADETRRLAELKGAINQKSREVFERIFMGEVMNRLYRDLLQIENLARRIQQKLAGRRFGSNRYTRLSAVVPLPAQGADGERGGSHHRPKGQEPRFGWRTGRAKLSAHFDGGGVPVSWR